VRAFQSLFSVANRSLDAVALSFAPAASASASAIRINGAICIAIGMLCMALFGAIVLAFQATPGMLIMPSLLAYACFTVGGYRVIRGKEPAAAHPGELSWSRILMGCVSVVFCCSLLIGMIAIAAAIFEK
jgi:hypothetical protein